MGTVQLPEGTPDWVLQNPDYRQRLANAFASGTGPGVRFIDAGREWAWGPLPSDAGVAVADAGFGDTPQPSMAPDPNAVARQKASAALAASATNPQAAINTAIQASDIASQAATAGMGDKGLPPATGTDGAGKPEQASTLPETMRLSSSSGGTSTTRTIVDEKARGGAIAQRHQAVAQMQDLNEELGAIDRDEAEGRLTVMEKMQARRAAMEKRIGGQIADSQVERDVMFEDLRRAVAEAKGDRVDPDRFWANRSTGSKIAMVVAAAMGGFTEGFTQGRVKDQTLNTINTMIDRDIRAQEANIRNRRGQRQEQRGLLASLDTRIGNLEMSRVAARAALKEEMAIKLAKVSQSLQGDRSIAVRLMNVAKLSHDSAQADYKSVFDVAQKQTKASNWSSRQVPVKQGKASTAKKAASEVAKDAMKATAMINKLHTDVMRKGLVAGKASEMLGKTPIIGALVETEGEKISADRQSTAVRIAKSEGVGQMSNDERMAYAQKLLGFGSTASAAKHAIKSAYAPVLSNIDANLQFAQGAERQTLQKTRKYIIDSMAKNLSMVK